MFVLLSDLTATREEDRQAECTHVHFTLRFTITITQEHGCVHAASPLPLQDFQRAYTKHSLPDAAVVHFLRCYIQRTCWADVLSVALFQRMFPISLKCTSPATIQF